VAYCTITEINDLMSEHGIAAATDDVGGESLVDSSVVNNAIERAEQRIKQFVTGRYDVTQFSSSNKWLKWCCATLSCVALYRRRGNLIPPGLQEQYDEYIEHLQAIRDGRGEIPDQAPRTEFSMAMSNLRIDHRYPTGKSRVVTTVSTGGQDSAKPRHVDHTALSDPYP